MVLGHSDNVFSSRYDQTECIRNTPELLGQYSQVFDDFFGQDAGYTWLLRLGEVVWAVETFVLGLVRV